MKVLSAGRLRLIPACVISAASLAAAVSPGAASATVGTQCSGSSITGQGAAIENVAQGVWTGAFSTSGAKKSCNGKHGSKGTPTVAYTSTSSGTGLKSWGASTGKIEGTGAIGFASNNAFIATGEAPNSTQQTNIIDQESKPTAETLETLPVAQFALTIYVNLPSGCTATSTVSPGRLVLDDTDLQAIYAGTITTWGGIPSTDGGDSISGSGCSTDPIKVVVRKENAGTTNVLKKYLGLINSSSLVVGSENLTWDQLSEGSKNTKWPTALPVVPTTVEGDEGEAKTVAETPGSIGYSNLAELRETEKFSGTGNGANTGKFWVEIENGSKGSGKSLKLTYADPASNGDVEGKASANCKKTQYSNGKNAFPPPSVTGLWNEVTTSVPTVAEPLAEKTYSLCNFAYVLAFTSYSLLPGTSEAEATTVNNFLQFVAEKSGGQKLLATNDYLGVPKGAVDTALIDGAAEIGY
jgi:hypothetical protein